MTKEQAYDEQISPLMARIIAICKQHKIAFICDFKLDDDLHCTSGDVTESIHPSKAQVRCWELLRPKAAMALAETVETLPDGSKKITIRRIS